MLDPCVMAKAWRHDIQEKIGTKGSSDKDETSVFVCASGCVIFGSKINSPMITATSFQGIKEVIGGNWSHLKAMERCSCGWENGKGCLFGGNETEVNE